MAPPSRRQLHSSVVLSGSVYVFGGFDDGEFKSDLFKYNNDKQEWKKLSPSNKIKGRHSHTAVTHGDKMYVYGGIHEGQECSDLFVYSPTDNAWKEINTSKPRWGHTAVVFGNSMIIFGGTTNSAAVDEMLSFDFDARVWNTIVPKSEVKPPARRYHSAVVKGEFMYVLGGLANNNNLQDFWRFNLLTHVWEQLPAGPAAGRRGHVALDYYTGMVVHGGKQRSQTHGDAHVFEYESGTWKVAQQWQTEPTYFHSGVVVGSTIFLFGGLQNSAGSTKATCSAKLTLLQPLSEVQDQASAFLQIPSFITANHLCLYLNADELIALSSTCTQLLETCDKSYQWEILVKSECFSYDKDTSDFRQIYLTQRKKYFHSTSIRDQRIMDALDDDFEVKVVVIGGGGVGKSMTVIRFVHNLFQEYDPTIEDSYRKQIKVASKAFLLDILDTAGPEEYSAMRDQYCRTGQLFIVTYDVTRLDSFEQVSHYIEQVRYCKADPKYSHFIIQGNKIDKEEDRVISRAMGGELAKKISRYVYRNQCKNWGKHSRIV